MSDNKNYLEEVKYPDNVKKYDISTPPIKQSATASIFTKIFSKVLLSLLRKGHTLEKINMDNLKSPYILLSNHMQWMDFPVLFDAVYPDKCSLVAANHVYYKEYFILEKIGCICTRRFIANISLVRHCHTVLQNYGDVFALFPEARYTPDGTQAILPDAIGKLVKKNNAPVVILLNHGNFF